MKYINTLDLFDGTLAYVFPRYNTATENVHTAISKANKEKRSLPAVGKWLGWDPFSSIQGSVESQSCSYRILPFTEALRWLQRRFYINVLRWDRSFRAELRYATIVDEAVHFSTSLVSHFHLCNIYIHRSYSIFSFSTESIFKHGL